MMTEEDSTKSPESGSSWKECLKLLKGLELEEVLEVLSGGFCEHCQDLVESRINNLIINKKASKTSSVFDDGADLSREFHSAESLRLSSSKNNSESSANKSHWQKQLKEYTADPSAASVNSHRSSVGHINSEIVLNDGLGGVCSMVDDGLLEEQKEQKRCSEVVRKKDFVYVERINGKATNVLEGLELHTKVFNAEEQKKIVECVYDLQRMGWKGQLRERTYSEPKKWMRGKGRVTLQFGCCYNYATDKNGNPPGIIRGEEVDPLPPLFKQMITRMVKWRVLPPTCIPNSCIVNIYDEGDCIPPHIDHHDFLRPFCTVSFLTECNILFGANLKVVDAGEFSGPVSIPLPSGSVLILSGNGADVAKHCVPGVPGKRISITFRRMDDSKLPYKFLPDPELMRIKPLVYSPSTKVPWQQQKQHDERSSSFGDHSIALSPAQQNYYRNGKSAENESGSHTNNNNTSYFIDKDDFPPLGGTTYLSQSRAKKARPKQ